MVQVSLMLTDDPPADGDAICVGAPAWHAGVIGIVAARLTERGKKKMQIIAAAMHKLVRIAHGVLKNQRPYDPNYAAAD